MGRSFSSAIVVGALLVASWYSNVPDLHGAGRQDQILHGDGVDYIGGGKPSGLQRLKVEIHLNLPLLAAIGIGDWRHPRWWRIACG